MSAKREMSYAFEIEGRLARTDVSGKLMVRLEHSASLESWDAWLPSSLTLPALVTSVAGGKGALTATLVESRRAETLLPNGSVMVVGASHEGKLLEYRAGRWITGSRSAIKLTAGHASKYFRHTANGLEIVIEKSGKIAASDINFNLFGVEVERINYGKYTSAYVFSPLTALMAILLAAASIGVWVIIFAILFGMR